MIRFWSGTDGSCKAPHLGKFTISFSNPSQSPRWSWLSHGPSGKLPFWLASKQPPASPQGEVTTCLWPAFSSQRNLGLHIREERWNMAKPWSRMWGRMAHWDGCVLVWSYKERFHFFMCHFFLPAAWNWTYTIPAGDKTCSSSLNSCWAPCKIALFTLPLYITHLSYLSDVTTHVVMHMNVPFCAWSVNRLLDCKSVEKHGHCILDIYWIFCIVTENSKTVRLGIINVKGMVYVVGQYVIKCLCLFCL